jgi:hypothetical protein
MKSAGTDRFDFSAQTIQRVSVNPRQQRAVAPLGELILRAGRRGPGSGFRF